MQSRNSYAYPPMSGTMGEDDSEEPARNDLSSNGPRKLVIATLTFRRPQGIGQLLPALVQQIEAISGQTLTGEILVVDNDDVPSARDQVSQLSLASVSAGGPEIRYEHEPQPGISAARNRVLDSTKHADLLAFIDDDGIPSDNWLYLLLDTFDRYHPAGVVGRMVPTYESEPMEWVREGGFFVRDERSTGSIVPGGATNNLLLDRRIIESTGVRFDNDLGLIGGEDSLFTNQIRATGGKFVWCNEATVIDMVPSSRLNRKWVLRRRFRFGASQVLVNTKLAKTPSGRLGVRLKAIGTSVVEAVLGLFGVMAGLVTRSIGRRARGEARVAKACGRFLGALGFQYEEYARG